MRAAPAQLPTPQTPREDKTSTSPACAGPPLGAARVMGATPIVRRLREEDLAEADRIFRTAFGTFLGLPDPSSFAGDADWVRSRFADDPEAAFAAELDGRLVGSNFAVA